MKTRLAWLVLVLVAFAGALAYGLSHGPATRAQSTKVQTTPKKLDLAPIRHKAALPPCPTSLGPAFPALTVPCLGGGPAVALRGAGTGRPTLVNVYGSWCGPCQEEMPVLRAFHDALPAVDLIGIDTEDEAVHALLFAIDVEQNWPAAVDDDGVFVRAFGGAVPQTLFLDGTGKVVHVQKGGYPSVARLKADVLRYLKVTA